MRQLVLVGAPRVEVADPAGRPAGTLYALPPPRDAGEAEPRFVATVNRWLLLSALAAVALALALSLPLSRRILGPVEAITAAARRMEAGDLAQRVPATSTDEIGDLARAFNAMADAVARSESLRRALVTDVAHELRTPLTNLRCQIEAVQDGLQPADAATFRSLHEETLLLARLVGDLQDLALAESGQLPLHRAPVPLADAVSAALASIRPIAGARGIRLQADVPLTLAVDADRERLAQVLRNLLANALTHTPDGGTIRVSAPGFGGPGRAWRWRTAARAFPPSTCRTCSIASIVPTLRGRGAPAAPAWGSRSSSSSWRRTAGRCRWRASPAPAPASPSPSRLHEIFTPLTYSFNEPGGAASHPWTWRISCAVSLPS